MTRNGLRIPKGTVWAPGNFSVARAAFVDDLAGPRPR
jgi:hypothetical protein